MALRPRAGYPLTRRPANTRTQFEHFDPTSELVDQNEARILQIYLPDFKREQVRYEVEDTAKTIRVLGNRPIGNSKRSIVDKVFQIPEDCNIDQFHDKFENGIFVITMPKKVVILPDHIDRLSRKSTADESAQQEKVDASDRKDSEKEREKSSTDSEREEEEKHDDIISTGARADHNGSDRRFLISLATFLLIATLTASLSYCFGDIQNP